MEYLSWGKYPKPQNQSADLWTTHFKNQNKKYLPRGLGRSYGDSCLLSNGTLLLMQSQNNFLEFDEDKGILTAQAGVSLSEIIDTFLPRGWFPPVVPGTKFVTLGGALANDIHGKNHHTSGTFGNHVLEFQIFRSDRGHLTCSAHQNPEIFYATIGGLGLTGVVETIKFKMLKVQNQWIDQEQIKFYSLSEFVELTQDRVQDFEYTVAWVDIAADGSLRGIFIRGNHNKHLNLGQNIYKDKKKSLSVPIDFPNWALNPLSVKIFNELYFRKNLRSTQSNQVHLDSFFFPLDGVHHWNRIYGKRGFIQYQLVLPFVENWQQILSNILKKLGSISTGSFLSVLKVFGEKSSGGLLSFPKPGITLALDFPIQGSELFKILSACDDILAEVGGRIYLAKDARMNREQFEIFYPKVSQFKQYLDPALMSDLWRRLT